MGSRKLENVEEKSPQTGPVMASSASSGIPRQSRIRFPAGPDERANREEGPFRTAPDVSSSPRRSDYPKFNLRSPANLGDNGGHERRRVRSTTAVFDASHRTSSYSRAQFVAGPSRPRVENKRAVSHTLENSSSSNVQTSTTLGSSYISDNSLHRKEDAHDLDDPHIMADLQKALQLKGRVEEQLRGTRSNSDVSSPFSKSPSPQMTSNPFLPRTLSHAGPSLVDHSLQGELVDFSPSVGRTPLHPVPTSSNDGATLDWTGTMSDDDRRERKWSMPLAKKSPKDKHNAYSHRAIVEKQESQYSDRLARIKGKASPQTLRKAEITKDQLQRRYTVLNASFAPTYPHLDLVKVVHWYAAQDDVVKKLIDEAEPMSWLRHLLHKRGDNSRDRSPWHLSALMVDEYVRSTSDSEFTHPMSQNISAFDVLSEAASSLLPSASRPASTRSVDLSSMRRKSDDLISFEPITTQSRRSSIGMDSKNSVDTNHRRWRHSLPGMSKQESPHSSLQSQRATVSVDRRSQQERASSLGGASPMQNMSLKRRNGHMNQHSDDGQSSAVDSSDGGRRDPEELRSSKARERKRSRFHLSLDLKSAQGSVDDMKLRSEPAPLSITDLRTDARTIVEPSRNLYVPNEQQGDNSTEIRDTRAPSRRITISPIPLRKPGPQSSPRRRVKLSLPSSLHSISPQSRKPGKRPEVQDHALQAEYARKKESLEVLRSRNVRMKFILQSTAKSIVDYDDTQHAMAEKLHLTYQRLPPEVLDAFSHDPAATSSRRLSGWRAVEDTHLRLERQRQILGSFIETTSENVVPLALPVRGIYDDATEGLVDLVDQLHAQRSVVLSQVRQTTELLAKVKKMRDELKPEYDSAGVHTSANYPELVRLESLLDEFVNQRNQLWKLGEASLSFVLTSVAPLMKTFGRPIWDELHDFLVIPIYRNDFSGEEHWYPMTFPKRGVAHWVRLFVAGLASPIVLREGFGLFISLLTEGYLLRIPPFIPPILVYLLFSAVMFVFALALFGLFVTVLCEIAIVLWWSAWILCIVR